MSSRIAATALLIVLACSRSEQHASEGRANNPGAEESRTSSQLPSTAGTVASSSSTSIPSLHTGREPMAVGGEVTAPIVIDRVGKWWGNGDGPSIVRRQQKTAGSASGLSARRTGRSA